VCLNPEAFFLELRGRVVGRRVSRRRLAGNSLLVYVDSQPGDDIGITLWFEPTWHLRGPDAVLAGSRQAQHDPEAENPDAGFESAADAVDVLNDRLVTDLAMEAVTGDLFLSLDGGYLLRTFVSDPEGDELWHIRDNVSKTRLRRSSREFTIVKVDA
jgi:hypothetical protein